MIEENSSTKKVILKNLLNLKKKFNKDTFKEHF